MTRGNDLHDCYQQNDNSINAGFLLIPEINYYPEILGESIRLDGKFQTILADALIFTH